MTVPRSNTLNILDLWSGKCSCLKLQFTVAVRSERRVREHFGTKQLRLGDIIPFLLDWLLWSVLFYFFHLVKSFLHQLVYKCSPFRPYRFLWTMHSSIKTINHRTSQSVKTYTSNLFAVIVRQPLAVGWRYGQLTQVVTKWIGQQMLEALCLRSDQTATGIFEPSKNQTQ